VSGLPSIVSGYDVPPFPALTEGWGVAIDIGTTTVVMELVGTEGTIAREAFLNGQSRFGSDVLSRVRAASLGRADDLKTAIVSGIVAGFSRLFAHSGLCVDDISLVMVAGNTAMCHFLLGLPSEGLGVAPFTPFALRYPDTTLGALTACLPAPGAFASSSCPVRILPGLGAFIGGDVIGGLAASLVGGCEGERSGADVFIDIGTNAEMALAFDGSILCASAAAGPAFEGGSISCGTGGIEGAVDSVRIEGNRFAYTVIGSGTASAGTARAGTTSAGTARAGTTSAIEVPGLCGSGIIDFLACALETGLVKPDGSLAPVCAERGVLLEPGGKIALSASDVRNLQLAKAAIRAGLAVLLEGSGLRERDVRHVHLAGGFGLHLREESAFAVGLLPVAFEGRVIRRGNTSLAGALRALSDPSFGSALDSVLSRGKIVQLADSPSFGRLFIDSMEFSRT
jgi:uncharacterized 2Fe-2S/4Fe-4S cluster protein (DUF4445 family)